jgi:hypothetical protein
MRIRDLPIRIGKPITVKTVLWVAAVLASTPWFGNPCLAQGSNRFGYSALSVVGEARETAAWLSDEEIHRLAHAFVIQRRSSVFLDATGARQVETGVGWVVAQRGEWRATLAVESYELSTSEQIDAPRARGSAGDHPAGAVVRPTVGATMSPIPAARQGFRHYSELRLSSKDVLVRGDSLTLRAGSDLNFILQGIGVADWAGDATALLGWRSRMELRWALPTTVGGFSFVSRVDRRANELGRGQLQLRWEAHL